MWGSCFWFCIRPPPARLLLPPPPLTCSHTTCPHTPTTCTQLTHRHPTHPQLARDAAAFCVAGAALCDIDLHFVWQAWHLTTSIVTLRGRRGTCRHFAWQARYVVVLVPSDDSWQRCAILTRLVVASVPGDDRCFLCIRFHG